MASLALHALVAVLLFTNTDQQPVSIQDTPLEIVFQDRSEEPLLIDTSKTKHTKQIKTKKEVKFKSNQTNRTELETWKRPEQQSNIQANLNAGGNNSKSKQTNTNSSSSTQTDIQGSQGRRPLPLPGFGGTNSQPLIPAYVQKQLPPGVRLGNITALNTDQHRFYSFNRRLLSRFIPLWGSRVRNALYKWIQENNSPAISQSWVTNVEVIMNDKGEIIEVQPFRLSGLWPIDNASIGSFKSIKNVPNPPKEMIDENGYIHLQFQTEVLWIPQPRVRYHGGGPGR